MILTDAVAIKQLSPFFILFMASIFLKEKINAAKITVFVLEIGRASCRERV